MRSIRNKKNLSDKKILLRLDLNVPLNKGNIIDTTRIDKIIPTLKFLNKQKAKVIILSHVGRPKGKNLKELSLKPICENLKVQLGLNVKLITQNINEIKTKDFFDKFDEEILVLENMRFYAEEENNDKEFAKHLASLGDLYVNDAFSCSHRSHASIVEISKFLPSISGLGVTFSGKLAFEVRRLIYASKLPNTTQSLKSASSWIFQKKSILKKVLKKNNSN